MELLIHVPSFPHAQHQCVLGNSINHSHGFYHLSSFFSMFAHAQLELPDLNLKLVTPVAHQLEYLDNSSSPIYLCSDCHAHIASHEAILSRTFQGRVNMTMKKQGILLMSCIKHGLAYLVSEVVNVSTSVLNNSCTLSTGRYIIADVTCKLCGSTLGWRNIFQQLKSLKSIKKVVISLKKPKL